MWQILSKVWHICIVRALCTGAKCCLDSKPREEWNWQFWHASLCPCLLIFVDVFHHRQPSLRHRDIKPSNLLEAASADFLENCLGFWMFLDSSWLAFKLHPWGFLPIESLIASEVNKNCDLKICDFGLARVKVQERSKNELQFDDFVDVWCLLYEVLATEADEAAGRTDYVVTRWYRAPEVHCIDIPLMWKFPINSGILLRLHALPQATSVKYLMVDRSCFILLNTLLRSMFGLQPKQNKFLCKSIRIQIPCLFEVLHVSPNWVQHNALFYSQDRMIWGAYGSDYIPRIYKVCNIHRNIGWNWKPVVFCFEAVGCILCELINRRPLFAGALRCPSGSISLGFEISVGGKDHVDQIRKIISTFRYSNRGRPERMIPSLEVIRGPKLIPRELVAIWIWGFDGNQCKNSEFCKCCSWKLE